MRDLKRPAVIVFACASLLWMHSAAADSMEAASATSVALTAEQPEQQIAVYVTDATGNPVAFPGVGWSGPTDGPQARIRPVEEIEIEPGVFENPGSFGLSVVAITPVGGIGSYEIRASYGAAPDVVFAVRNEIAGDAEPPPHVGFVEARPFPGPFALRNTAFPALSLRALAGDPGSDSTPVAGAALRFVPEPGSGIALSSDTATTNADGEAALTAFAGDATGEFRVSIEALPDNVEKGAWFLRVLRAQPTALRVLDGGGQQTDFRSAFAQPLRVQVLDADGQPVPYAEVEFLGPAEGAGILSGADADPILRRTFGAGNDRVQTSAGVMALADESGIAYALVAANDVAGTYAVTTRVEGAATTAAFELTNLARDPRRILANGVHDFTGASTAPGQRFGELAFRFVDENDQGIPGATLRLSAPTSGPSVVLNQSVFVTDADGWARTSGTANEQAGTYVLRATVDGLFRPGFLEMHNRPAGYSVGETLADVAGFDQDGQLRSLRGFLDGDSYLLLDVCTVWCTACAGVQDEGVRAIEDLAEAGVSLRIVPLLVDTSIQGIPSTQADARAWRNRFNLPGPVLHVSGERRSALRNAGWFVLGLDRPAFPTYLLVGPDGMILDRHVGGLSAAAIVEMVNRHLPSAQFIPLQPPNAAPSDDVRRARPVRVRVDAGAFGPRTRIQLALLDASGTRHKLRTAVAGADGSLDAVIDIPKDAAAGPARLLADSTDGQYHRSWALNILP